MNVEIGDCSEVKWNEFCLGAVESRLCGIQGQGQVIVALACVPIRCAMKLEKKHRIGIPFEGGDARFPHRFKTLRPLLRDPHGWPFRHCGKDSWFFVREGGATA